MRFFRSSKITLGLDVGSYSVKAVQLLKENPDRIRLISFGLAEIEHSPENPTKAIIAAINRSLRDCNLKKTRLVTSLGGSSVVIKQVTFPLVSPKEIGSSLKWEASRHIPMPLDSLELKFQIRTVNKDEKTSEVLLVAVDKRLLQRHLELLSQIPLRPHIVDVNPLALANAFLALSSENEDKNIAMIDIGASGTIITIFRKGGFFFARDISVGGDKFTREIQNTYRLGYAQAEHLKKEKNTDLDQMKPVLNQLLSEIRQSLLFYDTKTGNKGYDEFIVTGGGAKLPGLSTYLERNLNLPIINFNPLKNVPVDKNFSGNDLEKAESQLGVAMGLALRK